MTLDWNGHAEAGGPDVLRGAFDRGFANGRKLIDANAKTGLVVTRASDIKPEKVQWLWQERFPLGKCTLVAGEGGLGKSMVLAWIAATVSRGREWPRDEGHSPLGSTIVLSAEDDAADTLVPRLIAADADCTKIHILSAVYEEDDKGCRSFNLQHDLPKLEKKITELNDVLVVIIDPITSYLGKVDSHKNAELRSVLEPLGEMAARLDVTVIANTHLSKAAGGSANNRVIGSVAFVNHARAAFIITADPEDNGRRLFIPSKTNLGRPREGLAYRITDTTIMGGEGELMFAPYVKWEASTVTISADEAVAAMAGGTEERSAKEEAKDFLMELLSDGPHK
jgi:RecA-family ATPase